MPKGHYDRRGLRFRRGATVLLTEPDPIFRPDINRGLERLAAEVVLAELSGEAVPRFAHERAFDALLVMAKG